MSEQKKEQTNYGEIIIQSIDASTLSFLFNFFIFIKLTINPIFLL